MKTFNYKVRSESGAAIDGVAEANTLEEAVVALKDAGFIVETIEETSSNRDIDLRLGGRKAKENSLAIMCNQFAIILTAGMPIVRTLQLVANQTEDKTLKKILNDVADDISAGYSLADSFAKHGEGLPTTFIETVRAGENSGNLDTVFRRLSDFYEKSSKTKSKAKSAMIYPSFVIGIAIIVIAIIMLFAVPTFTTTFASMGVQLPWITQFMIDSSHWWTNNILIVIGVIIVAIIAVKFAKKNDDFRMKWSSIGVKIPVIGRINLMNAASQYSGTMGVMMEAGLSVINAVGVTARSMSNYYMGHELASMQFDLESGKPLATCLAKIDVFPELVTEMTGVGEQTGSLEHTLGVLSEYYDNEVETASSRALSILEPLIIVILAVVVCGILLAVYLPMFSLYGSFGQ
jgi:type IV pilus assembly protein PilC